MGLSIQGENGPENVDTTEAVSSPRWETRPGRTYILFPCAFLLSFIKDMAWVVELMLFDPNCWIPRDTLLFKGMALVKPPFKLLSDSLRLLVPGLKLNRFSCWTTTWGTFFFSCKEKKLGSSWSSGYMQAWGRLTTMKNLKHPIRMFRVII